MKGFDWNNDKNQCLKENRGISFENIAFCIEHGGLVDSYEHPNREKYANQSIFVVACNSYYYLVPYVEEEEYFFLKTIIPNRKARRTYGEADD